MYNVRKYLRGTSKHEHNDSGFDIAGWFVETVNTQVVGNSTQAFYATHFFTYNPPATLTASSVLAGNPGVTDTLVSPRSLKRVTNVQVCYECSDKNQIISFHKRVLQMRTCPEAGSVHVKPEVAIPPPSQSIPSAKNDTSPGPASTTTAIVWASPSLAMSRSRAVQAGSVRAV